MSSSSPDKFEPECAIEHSNLALCVISDQGELRYRDPPTVINQGKRGPMVFISFVAQTEEAFQLFLCNSSSYDASADISVSGKSLGKWLIPREPNVWHNIACDSLFKFQESYGRQSRVFEPTAFEIRFQHLSKVVEGLDQDNLVPVMVRQPSPEDGPGFVLPSDDVMQSKFEVMEDIEFLTFFILFYPPTPSMIIPPIQTVPISSQPSTIIPPIQTVPISSQPSTIIPPIQTVPHSSRPSKIIPPIQTIPISSRPSKIIPPIQTVPNSSRPSMIIPPIQTVPNSSRPSTIIPPIQTVPNSSRPSMTIPPIQTVPISSQPSTIIPPIQTVPNPSRPSMVISPIQTVPNSSRPSMIIPPIQTVPISSRPSMIIPPIQTAPISSQPSTIIPPIQTVPVSSRPSMIIPPIQTVPISSPEPGPASASASSPSSESGSASSSDSISQMSEDEIQGALTEYKDSRLLLPARLTPGYGGKLPVEEFCRRYELPEIIPSVLTRMKIKDAHSLSRVYLRELRDNGLAAQFINMLRLAVIRFSSESRP